MRAYIAYLISVLRHKWFVFIEAYKLGIPWLGVVHDLSKFRPAEFVPYAKYFYGKRKMPTTQMAFDIAWLYHQKYNKHHWQYWILMNDSPENVDWMIQEYSIGSAPLLAFRGRPLLLCESETEQDDAIYTTANIILHDVCARLNKLQPLPMPDKYRREMLADWMGAGRAYGNPDTLIWYIRNRKQIILHEETRKWVEQQLRYPAKI